MTNLKNLGYTFQDAKTMTRLLEGKYHTTCIHCAVKCDDNWNLLLYKEAYHIKRSTPFLNTGLKASRELCLFS